MKVGHIARRLILGLAIALDPLPSLAITVTQPYPIVPHTTASASQVQADFGALYSTINGYLDASNFASGSGVYASQIVPTNTAQGTFGGSQLYTFPNSVLVNGGVTTNGFVNNGPATINGNTNIVGNATATGYVSGHTVDSAYSSTQGIYYAGSSNAAQLDYNVTNAGEWTLNQPTAISGFLNVQGQIIGNSTVSGVTGGTTTQVLPTIVNASPVSGQANAHMEAFAFTASSASFSGTFAKTFDALPRCVISSAGSPPQAPSAQPVSITSYSATNLTSGYGYTMICVGS